MLRNTWDRLGRYSMSMMEAFRTQRLGIGLGLVFVPIAPVGMYSFVSLPAFLAAAAVVGFNWRGFQNYAGSASGTPLGVALTMVVTYMTIASLWSPSPDYALFKVIRLAFLVGAGVVLIAAAYQLSFPQLRRASFALYAVFATTVVLYVIEVGSGAAISIWLNGLTPPSVEDDPAYIDAGLAAAHTTMLALTKINRGGVFLAILCWPIAMLAAQQFKSRYVGMSVIGITFVLTLFLHISAAPLAIAVGVVVFLFTFFLGRKGLRFFFASVACAVVIAPIAAGSLDRPESLGLDPQTSDPSILHRIEIYRYVAHKTADRPLFGHGFSASRFMGKEAPEFLIPDAPSGRTSPTSLIPLHTHNLALQVWLELGAVGAGLLAFMLVAIGQYLTRHPRNNLTLAMYGAASATILTFSAITFGAWQYHWISAMLICVAALVVADRLLQLNGSPPHIGASSQSKSS